MFNVLNQLQTIQNARFGFIDNSIAGAKSFASDVRDGIFLYEGADAAIKQEGTLAHEGDKAALQRRDEATALAQQYSSRIKEGVQGVIDELKDASEIGELDYGTFEFAGNKDAVEKIWKTVSKADKVLKTTTPNPVEQQLTATEPARKHGKSKSRTRFEEASW